MALDLVLLKGVKVCNHSLICYDSEGGFGDDDDQDGAFEFFCGRLTSVDTTDIR